MQRGLILEESASGSMPARLVAGLAGVTIKQLRLWRRSGVVKASALPPRRGVPCAYRWDEYRRARLAALLLLHGLKPRRLRRVLDEYFDVVSPDTEPPTTVADQRAIVKQSDGLAHTAERGRQGAAFDFVSAAPLDQETIAERLAEELPDESASIEVIRELSKSWPLGRLQEYSDIVDVRPEVLGGAPTIRGSRLETAALDSLFRAGETVEMIAKAYQLTKSTVERVLDFERALEAHATAPG